ncbi:MAG: hypothetical protein J6B01_04515 [Ruminococcus sp.]|nr:hypothetical protein [Ruminococcus sp.]
MGKLQIMNTLSDKFGKVGLQLKKHSPEILIAAGAIGAVTSTVMACKATLKVHDIIEGTKNDIEKMNVALENGATAMGQDYTEDDYNDDMKIAYIQTGAKVIKEYAPAVILGTLSIGAMVKSHNILRKRNAALAAAYTVVNKGFKEYRGRVIERFGEQIDKELRYNIKAKEVEEIVTDKDGNETTVVTTVDAIDPTSISDYAKFFDESCTGWTKNPELNMMFLKSQERYANERLKSKGHLFLNEVYDMLGIDRTTAGQHVGWLYDEAHPNGDNYVDFGIFRPDYAPNRRFVNGYERNILLDFNVDGPIIDLI